jgi:Putative transposase/Transposase zinc-binding domain
MATLADALGRFGAGYLATHTLSTPQAKAWRAIAACRTPALGGQQLACDGCGHRHWQYHSCRNRHCPRCGARARDAWLKGRLAEALPVPYVHLVFTLPHDLNALYGAHPRWVIDTLFASTAETLTELAANPRWIRGADGQGGHYPAFTLMLHTWTQDLRRHLHVHAVMAAGALDGHGHWCRPTRKPDFLFPVQALSSVFRGKFMAALGKAHREGELADDPAATDAAWRERQRALYRHAWVVYAKAPLGGPSQVLEYLSRYTHRTAISNERIVAIDDGGVVLSVRADADGGKRRIRLDGVEFVRRILLHVLPTGIKRIRHYGLLAPACKTRRLNEARAALAMPLPNPAALESAADFMRRVAGVEVLRCPCCAHGRLRVVRTLRGLSRLPAPGAAPPSAACRGPP